MKRIASIAFTHYASDARVRRMCEALAERGDEVIAFTIPNAGEPRRQRIAGVDVRAIPIRQHRGSNALLYVWQYIAFSLVVGWRLLTTHLRTPLDLVHVNNMPDFIVFAALPVKLLGVRVVFDIHDPMPELYEVKFGAGPDHPAVRLIGAVERRSIAFADAVISVHDVQAETFAGRGSPIESFTIVQNVADTRYFPVGAALEADKDPERIQLVYHGTMAPRLGLDLLLRAVAKASTEIPNLHLLLIGDGDDTPRLLRMIDELDLADVVTFDPEFIPVDELLPHLVRSDIGVVPANVNPFTRNMLPVKLLEYVTLGIPSISTDLETVRRYFEPGEVVLVPPGDVDAMAEAIVALAEDKEMRLNQARAALTFVERHSWQGERDTYLALVDRLTTADGAQSSP